MERLPEDDAGHRWQSTRIALREQNAKLPRHGTNGPVHDDDTTDDQPPAAA